MHLVWLVWLVVGNNFSHVDVDVAASCLLGITSPGIDSLSDLRSRVTGDQGLW